MSRRVNAGLASHPNPFPAEIDSGSSFAGEGLGALFADREDVFVAADLLWHPLEGDALVLYRPDGERFVPYVELRQRAEQAEQRAQEAEERARRLAQRLREMGIEPEEL